MAVFAAPFAAAGIGGLYILGLSRTYSAAANFSAKQAFGLEDAYPWPFWKTWFDSGAQSNSTPTGNLGALLLAGLAYGVQRRLIWRHVGNSLRMSRAEQGNKIQDTSHFIRAVGPGIAEFTANALSTSACVGLARPLLDGNNLQATST